MTVLFSRKAEIAIKALMFLATKEPGTCVDVNIIAAELHIPKIFAAKILQELVYSGLVNSKKGKNGGFFLIEKGNQIKISQIVEAIDGLNLFRQCLFGFPECSDEHPCPIHVSWGKIRNEIFDMLDNLTIGDMKEDTLIKLKTL